MKYYLAVIGLLLFNMLHAQELIFDSTGRWTNQDAISNVVEKTYTLSRTTNNPLRFAVRQNIKKTMAQNIQVALNNIDDDSLDLKNFYTSLWGSEAVDSIIADLEQMKSYLSGRNYDVYHTFSYIPSIAELEYFLDTADVFKLSSNIISAGDKKVSLIYTDPYRNFLVKTFNKSVADQEIDELPVDSRYIRGWRQLDQWYIKLLTFDTSFLARIDTATSCDFTVLKRADSTIASIHQSMQENYVVNLLRTNNFFKSWLWYTGGILKINPINYTTPDRKFIEKNKTSAIVNELDSLKNFETIMQVQNEISLPVKSGDDNDREIYLWNYNYNAAKNLLTKNDQKTKLTQKEGLAFCVHNIPTDLSIELIQDTSRVLIDKSSTIIGLDNLLDAGEALGTSLASIKDIWGKLSLSLNSRFKDISRVAIEPKNPGTKKEKAATAERSGINLGSELMMIVGDFKMNDVTKEQLEQLKGKQVQIEQQQQQQQQQLVEEEESINIEINGRVVVMSNVNNDDKRKIILAGLRQSDEDTCSHCNDYLEKARLIDPFLEQDVCYTLNYTGSDPLKTSIENLSKRFNCFIRLVNECRQELRSRYVSVRSLETTLKWYMNISERSLPPVLLEPKTERKPFYRSLVVKAEMPETPKHLEYTISLRKVIDGKDSIIIQEKTKFKRAPLHYIDLSIGLSYLAAESGRYLLSSQSGNTALPEISEGERFKLMAGLHIYPWGLYKIDNKFFHWKERRHRASVFLGVGIKDPLENYFTGLSYDLVPGMRIIAGAHFFKHTKYKIVNDLVVDKAAALKASGVFFSFNLEPVSFIKLLQLF